MSPTPSLLFISQSQNQNNIYFELMRKRHNNLAEDMLCRHCYSAGKTGMPFSSPFPFLSAVVSQAMQIKALWQLYQNLVQDYTSIFCGEQTSWLQGREWIPLVDLCCNWSGGCKNCRFFFFLVYEIQAFSGSSAKRWGVQL